MNDSPLDARAVFGTALVALCGLLPVYVLGSWLDQRLTDFDHSGWYTVVAILTILVWFAAGLRAGILAPRAPLSNAAIGVLLAFVLFLPVRVLLWLWRSDSKGLFTGPRPLFAIGTLVASALVAMVIAMIGALISSRSIRGRITAGDEPARRPRTGFDPSEERPDSTGQGAG
ncbi:MAG: hypothetical protein JWL73_2165 [Actinomycetia bacterium]|nr:hypothetical protein [Actinomycetes bacterium]